MGRERTNAIDAQEAFFRGVWQWLCSQGKVPPMDDASDPIKRMDRLKAKFPTKAAAGLREAIHDLVEMTQDVSGRDLEKLDGYLQDSGAPTLTSMRSRQKK